MVFIHRSKSLPCVCVCFFSKANTPSCLPFQRKLLFSGRKRLSWVHMNPLVLSQVTLNLGGEPRGVRLSNIKVKLLLLLSKTTSLTVQISRRFWVRNLNAAQSQAHKALSFCFCFPYSVTFYSRAMPSWREQMETAIKIHWQKPTKPFSAIFTECKMSIGY